MYSVIVLAAIFAEPSAAPYPHSSVIKSVDWADASTIVRRAPGGDNWPISWGDDDALYTAYGDGRGFKPFVEKKLSLGLARVTGSPTDFIGRNLRSPDMEQVGQGPRGKKASGLLMVDGMLYLWARNAGNSQLAWSRDRGTTWVWSDWRFRTSLGYPTFLNFGKNYEGARDRFVYVYSHDSDSAYDPADKMVLARVPQDLITDRKAYRFFQRIGNDGEPVWTRDIADRGAVFAHAGHCYRSGITYNAPLKRYLWCQIIPGDDTRFQGGFGIYDAAAPWGPWTTAYFTNRWDVGPGETSSIPTKWISENGRTVHLVFSGDDAFSVRRGTLTLARSRNSGKQTDEQSSSAVSTNEGGTDVSTVFPDKSWQRVRPTDVGMNEARLTQARDYALTGGGSGYITRHGKLVMSWGDLDRRYDLKSTTKSIGVTALGLAIQDGKIKLSDLARQHHAEFGRPPESNAANGWLDQITIRHLATQTAGFEKPGGYEKLVFKPGTKWHYSDGGPNWLAECVTLTYQRDLHEVMAERVFKPLHITPRDLSWRKNAYRDRVISGVARREFGSGISANVDAMARLGYLYLREGRWRDLQIIPREFVQQVRNPVTGVVGLPEHNSKHGNASDHYGLLWWNNADGTLPDVPSDAFWSWGLYDSLILVIPSMELVASRAGKSWKRGWSGHYDVLKPFFQPIIASVRRGQ